MNLKKSDVLKPESVQLALTCGLDTQTIGCGSWYCVFHPQQMD